MNICITGGAGFIGSHLVKHFVKNYPSYNIFNLDALTYAGSIDNVNEVSGYNNYSFLKCNIRDFKALCIIFEKYNFDYVIHLAAESHVDRSIRNPIDFAETNILGTINLLNAFRLVKGFENKVFYHVSTDEVYGSLGDVGSFCENSNYQPRSPYAASKASSDHFVRAYGETYGIPYIISNCSNNYGEFQYPEKLIPLIIMNILNEKPLPIYGDGKNVRDWLYVQDHINAIDTILHSGNKNQTYNIGGDNELSNIDLVNLICKKMDKILGKKLGSNARNIVFVKDRPGHDKRYAINSSKLKDGLNWSPKVSMEEGLDKTIDWFIQNKNWIEDRLS